MILRREGGSAARLGGTGRGALGTQVFGFENSMLDNSPLSENVP